MTCFICDETKGLEEFSKAQRRNPDAARCLICVDDHLFTNPSIDDIDDDDDEDEDEDGENTGIEGGSDDCAHSDNDVGLIVLLGKGQRLIYLIGRQ